MAGSLASQLILYYQGGVTKMNEIKQKTVEKLEEIADVLYKGNTVEGMAMMTQVIDNLGIIAGNIVDEEQQKSFLNDGLIPAVGAMENNDGILLADIITYEIISTLNNIG